MSKSDLIVLQQMAEGNMDISSSSTLISAEKVKQGGKITFGISEQALMNVMNNVTETPTHYAVVYIINKKQFDKLKKS